MQQISKLSLYQHEFNYFSYIGYHYLHTIFLSDTCLVCLLFSPHQINPQ